MHVACNMEIDTRDWIQLIEEQIELSDRGCNIMDLNELYYDFYLHIKRLIKGVE